MHIYLCIHLRAELPRNVEANKFPFSLTYCHQLNMSVCGVKDHAAQSFIVNIFNPLGQYIDKYIRVPVTQGYNKIFYNFKVIDSKGMTLTFD